MFYSVYVLTKKGFLAPIWTEGTTKNRLTKKQVINSNIRDMCLNVIEPKCGPLALRLSAVLMLGITRIHNRQCRYLLSDTNDLFGRVRFQSQPQAANLPEETSLIRQERIDLPVDASTLQQSILDLNLTSTQLSLEPILDRLGLEASQLLLDSDSLGALDRLNGATSLSSLTSLANLDSLGGVPEAEHSLADAPDLEGLLAGMATPLSDIPPGSDPTLHRLDGPSPYPSLGPSLSLRSPHPARSLQDIDFGLPDLLSPSHPADSAASALPLLPFVLPRNSPAKRASSLPDTRIELPSLSPKRVHADPAFLVAPRPSLPPLGLVAPPRYGEDIHQFLRDRTRVSRSLQARSVELPRAFSASPQQRRAGEADPRSSHRMSIENGEWPDPLDVADLGGESMPIVDTTMAVGIDSPGVDLRKISLSAGSSASSTPSQQNTLRLLSLLDDAGLKDHPVEFGKFAADRTRSFAAKSFYHLLVLATDQMVLVTQVESYGEIEITDNMNEEM